jgi:hypothetical protein
MDEKTRALAELAVHAKQCNLGGCKLCYETVNGRRQGRLKPDAVHVLAEAAIEQDKHLAALWSTIETVGESRQKLIDVCNTIPREISITETVECFHLLYAAVAAFVKETTPDT